MIDLIETYDANLLHVRLSGKLVDDDYDIFIPIIEALLGNAGGRVSLLAEFADCAGWEPESEWNDIRFGLRHDAGFRRIAVVGDLEWEEWMARFCQAFTSVEVEFFTPRETAAALAWAQGG